jgi:hypothetical protein
MLTEEAATDYKARYSEAIETDTTPFIGEENTLISELKMFREKKILPRFKNYEKSILSNEMLEEFVKMRPTSREEFQKFPLKLREQIDPKQSIFLDEILDLIEQFGE